MPWKHRKYTHANTKASPRHAIVAAPMYTSVASKPSTGEGDSVVVCGRVSMLVVRDTLCELLVVVSVDFDGTRVASLGQVTTYPLAAQEAFKENS